MTWVQRLLWKVLSVQTSYPRLIVASAIGLAVLSITYTVGNLQFWTSQRALLSREDRLVRLSETADQFSDFDTFVVAIEGHDKRRSLEFLKILTPKLEADRRHYLEVFSRVDPEQFKPWALLYLKRQDLLLLRDNIQEHGEFIRKFVQSPGLCTFFEQVNNEMAERMVGELFTGFLDVGGRQDRKPMDLQFLIRTLGEMKGYLKGTAAFASPWNSFFAQGDWGDEGEEGYFWTENKRYLLLFVTPAEAAEGFSPGQASLAQLRQTINAVRTTGFPDINVGVTGQKALDEDEMGAAMRDMSVATLLSLAGLAVLLVVFWHGIRRPLIEITSLLVALSLTFGFTTIFIGHLNLLSVVFAPMLLGLGIDYGIHWFARYREEQQYRGASKEEALQTTMVRLGPGIVLAGLTAALSFLPLAFTGFKGLAELGIICAIGLVMATVTTLCLLPALLVLFDKTERPHSAGSASGVRALLRPTNSVAFLLVVFAGITAGFSLRAAGDVQFDLNMLHIQSKKAESVIWEKKLIEGSQRPSMYGVILAHSLGEVEKKTKALKALPTVSEVQSAADLLPSDQAEKISILRPMKPLLAGIGPLSPSQESVDVARLDGLLGRIRFKMLDSSAAQWGVDKPLQTQMREVRGLISDIRRLFARTGRVGVQTKLKAFEKELIKDLGAKLDLLRAGTKAKPMGLEDLPKQLRERYIGQNDSLYPIRAFPAQNIWEPDLLKGFVHDLRSVDPDAVGDPVTLYVFTQAFRDACIMAALYAILFTLALLLLTFRSLVLTLLAVTPLVVGTLWTLGLMYLFGIDLNVANSIFLPLILGAGVEYGIIVVQRRQQKSGDDFEGSLPASTGLGVILAGLTTTVGFGSLTISEHQGVYSLGLLTTIGSLTVLAAAVIFLPALLQLIPDRVLRGRGVSRDNSTVVHPHEGKEKERRL